MRNLTSYRGHFASPIQFFSVRKLFTLILFLSMVTLKAQNYYVPHTLNMPQLPAPTFQIEWADVNLDGFTDMVSVNEYNHHLLVYPNNSGVVDSVPVSYAANIEFFFVSDWNNDGRKDIVYSKAVGSGLELMLNNPSGGFFAPVALTIITGVTINSYNLSLRDLNADNFPDMVIDTQDTLYLLYNNAGNTTLTGQSIALPSHTSANLTDVDGDTQLDLVMIVYNAGFNRNAVVYQNTGSFNFVLVDTIAFTNGPTNLDALYCRDLDNDGTDEILASSAWQLYVAQKSSGFQFNEIHTSSFFFQQITTGGSEHRGITDFADIDGNGYKDIVIANSVYFNNNATLSRIDILAQPDFNYPYVKVTDTNNDSVKELWWNMHEYALYGESFVYSITHNSGSTLFPRVRKWDVNAYLDAPYNSNYIDLDNDGDRDYLYQSAGRVLVSVNDGSGNLLDETVIAPIGLQDGHIDIVDVDQDGLPDLLETNGSSISGFYMEYYHNNGNLQFTSMGNIFNLSPGEPHLIAFDDFDNDNIPDFVFSYYRLANPIRVEVFKNNLTNFPSQGIIFSANPIEGTIVNFSVVSDFDHNGYLDIAAEYDCSTVGNYGGDLVLLNNGAFSFNAAVNTVYSSNQDQHVGMADVNSDGFEDFLISRYDNFFMTSTIKARLNNGSGAFGPETAITSPFNLTYGFFTTDVNNDGLKDVVNSENFQVAINNGASLNTWIANGTLENPSSLPVQMDFDGDGDMDLLNTFEHTWFDNASVSPQRINGTVFYDVNANGVNDGGDIALTNFPVGTNPLIAVTNTDASGQFSLLMGGTTGTFAVESKSNFNGSFTFTTIPYPDSATVDAANPIDSVSIGFYAAGGIHQARLDQALSSHRCNETARLWINADNFSPLASSMNVQLTLPANVTYVNSSITPSSQAGNVISWSLNTTAFEEKKFWVNVVMPNANFIGDTLAFVSTLSSTQVSGTIIIADTLLEVLTCAFDPNDKLTVPLHTQLSGDKFYAFDDYVEYQVRFQNTGNDTAQTVVIKDLLNSNFDLATMEVISASHDFNFTLDNNHLLTVNFNNIQLPDSGANFTGSMGYVKFGIRLLPGTPHNVAISNSARIYFDQNDAIYTNPVDIYRVGCPDFITPVYSGMGFCSGTNYTAVINNHGLNAAYTWSLDGNTFATNDSVSFSITHTGNNLINIHIDLGVCQYDSLQTFNVTQTAALLTLDVPADTTVCPNQYISLNSNLAASWYVNNSLVATSTTNFAAFSGDTVVVTYTSGFCVSQDQTILRDLFPMQETLLNDPFIQLGQVIYVCEGDNIVLNSYNNVSWEWWLDNYPAAQTDTATGINIFADPLATMGNFNLKFDTLGCHYEEYYDLFIGHAASQPLVFDTSLTFYCPGQFPLILINDYLDSLQFYIGGIYDTTWLSVNSASWYALENAGAYTAIGYNYGCAHPAVNFNVTVSTAPFAEVMSFNNVLYTSDGTSQTWYYSVDNTTYTQIAIYDTLYGQPEGFYYIDAENSDGCFMQSQVYYFQITGWNELQNGNITITHNSLLNELSVTGLSNVTQAELLIYNNIGQTVVQTKAVPKAILPQLSAGVYLVMIQTDKGVYTSKVVIK